MDRTIQELQTELEDLLIGAGFKLTQRDRRLGRVRSDQTPRVQVYWGGINPETRQVGFAVQVIVAERHFLGDEFLKVWNTLVQSEGFSPILPDGVSYNDTPLGSDNRADFVQIDVWTNQVVDVLTT